ncbi:VCBS repeat-containing protein [Myroides sp. 1354]|uniref:FG-GAP-like repeat-containing protein n=1 Tax=unclassified Myroides TaxID=2642485 RepID=UPI0025762C24|nr:MULTISPECIES: FG-GAP-like repeat-containing protein [unclassified Myroides]MDM1046331.1 VCBS repeat-containing protein [Myroides sp. R163-1]MDM1057268.1 VCBS repeat-containing protein [Myroides sp. 1354]MDM1070497.1 VCBS repeat-containing protein [Myroides sp. 1372]
MSIYTIKKALILYGLCVLGGLTVQGQHFSAHTAQTFPGVFYGDAAILNVNNDAYPDLVFSGTGEGYGSGNTFVYLNEQNHFTALADSFSQIMYSAIETGDIDGDGKMDFAITGFRKEEGFPNEKVFEIYYNNGDNTFTKKNITTIVPAQYGSIKIADLNGDGLPDLLVNGQTDGGYSSKVYFQQADGEFLDSNIQLLGTYFSATEIFDANGDGLPDILITGFSTSYVPSTQLYINEGNGNFRAHDSGLGPVYFSSISVADYEGDGDLDVLLSGMNGSMTHSLVLYLNDGQGNFTPAPYEFEGIIMGSCALVDYNKDGLLDVFAFGSTASSNIKTNLYKNQNNQSFVLDVENSNAIRGLSTSRAKWFDFDQDGDMDLFVIGYTSDGTAQTTLYENTIEPTTEAEYCEVRVLYGVEPITLVQFANLNNQTDIMPNPTVAPIAYEDFTSLTANVQRGQTYTLTVKGNTNGNFEHDIRAFIDWNNDGQFDVRTELYRGLLSPSTGQDEVKVEFEIRVPDDAVLGKTRMRIIKDNWYIYEEGEFDACTDAEYGQIEDYSVQITDGTVEPGCNNEEPGMNPGDTGCVTFTYNGSTVTYTTVRAGDGTIWLQQNLGSEQVATAATDASAYGDLFQWGRWDDGHQKRTSTVATEAPTPNNPRGLGVNNNKFYSADPSWWQAGAASDTWEARIPQDVTDTAGCDPCKALGEGWTLPTQDQWQAIIAAENITNIQTAYDSNLRLTVAGARGSNGVYNEGLRGYYWSKTTSTNRDFVKHLFYSNLTMNAGAGAPREQGSAIRCLKLAPVVTPEDYCLPEISDTARSLPIYEVTFDTTTKTSGSTTATDPLYEDFTSTVLPVEQGGTYPITVKGKTDGQDMLLVKVYIDYNHDFEFSENETVTVGFLNNTGGERGEVSGTIQVPIDALIGTTRMRVVSMYHNPETTWVHLENVPCPTGYYLGQVEDYTLNVQRPAVGITGVEITTENNVTPEITTENGTLQLQARVIPAEANQAVTWTIVEGETLASIDQNGRVSALANGVVKIKATSVQNTAKFAEIEVNIDIETLRCPPVQLSIDNIGEETATLQIESTGTVFEVEYGVEGFTQGEGTKIEQATATQQIQGLSPEVTYDVYVRVAANCSTWQKISFTTIKVKEQLISVENVNKVYGDAPFQTGESTSQLPLNYTVVDPTIAVIEGGRIVIKGAGETEIRVNQAGNSEYLPAEEVRFTLRVAKAPLTVQATNQTKVYNGVVHTAWTATYDGFVYGENVSVLTGTLRYEGTAIPAVNVGTYSIEPMGYESPNYEIQYRQGTLSITKAIIEGITFRDGAFLYDGTPKFIEVTGQLPQGVSVTYEGNTQIEIGNYTVSALLHGGENYEDKTLQANLQIRHALADLVFEDATFVYDGTAKRIEIQNLPEGVSVTYEGNDKIEAGTYTVIASIQGGGQYENTTLRATLKITKAPINAILFEGQTFVYDGTAKYIFVSGAIPQGVTVEHINNGKIDVGSYEVKARVNGGNNYQSRELVATLKIEKASQQIRFDELETIILDESEDFQLQATTTSGLPLQYTYTYTETQPAAEVSTTGWVTLKKVGEITITVAQAGDKNYHPATAVSRMLRIVNNDATIHEIWIGDEHYTTPQNQIYHLMRCDEKRAEVAVKIVVDEGATITPNATFVIATPKPGIYKQTVTVVSQNGKVKETYVIVVEKPFAFDEIAVKKFNNTLLINKNPQTNGGYHFVGFQWYKNGTLVSEEQVYSAGAKAILDRNSVYHAIVKTAEGEEIHVCPMEEMTEVKAVIQLYPNPVVLGQKTTLEVQVTGVQLRGIPVQVFNLNGQLVHTFSMEGERTAIYLPQTIQGGMYVAVFELNGRRESIKFAVKK